MQSFRMTGLGVMEFCRRVEEEIRARDFQDIASMRCSGETIRVEFSWMGCSTLEFWTEADGDGFVAHCRRERMSPFHMGFRRRFEQRFAEVLEAVGAEFLP